MRELSSMLTWLDTLIHGNEGKTYLSCATMFGHTQIYDVVDADNDLIRVLDVDDTWQSASYIDEHWSDLCFAYHRVIDSVMFDTQMQVSHMLVLGGGALSLPKHTVVTHPEVTVDVVEPDRAITKLARRFFFLDRLSSTEASRIRVAHTDGASFLADALRMLKTYDVIINDAFAASEPPSDLLKDSAIVNVHTLLAPKGVYLANVVSALTGYDASVLKKVTATLTAHFRHVWVIPLGADTPEIPDNNIVIATDGDYHFAEVRSLDQLG